MERRHNAAWNPLLLAGHGRRAACRQVVRAFTARRLKGVFDVRRALEAARAGLVLHPLVLGAIGLTLQAAQRVDDALQQPVSSSGDGFPALLQLAAGLRGGAPELQAALFQCIQAGRAGRPSMPVWAQRGCGTASSSYLLVRVLGNWALNQGPKPIGLTPPRTRAHLGPAGVLCRWMTGASWTARASGWLRCVRSARPTCRSCGAGWTSGRGCCTARACRSARRRVGGLVVRGRAG